MMEQSYVKPRGWIFVVFCLGVVEISKTSAAKASSGQNRVGEGQTDQQATQLNVDLSQAKVRDERNGSLPDETLLQARRQRTLTPDVTDQQLRTEAPNQAATIIEYLRRGTAILSSKVRRLGSKVHLLENWKETSENRFKRLENMVLGLQIERTGLSAGRADHDEFEFLANDVTSANEDAALKDLMTDDESLAFEGLRGKAKRGADTNARSSSSDVAHATEVSEMDYLSNALMKLNKTVQDRGKLTYKLFTRVGRNQRYMVRRFNSLELKTRRVQRIAERALSSMRTQNTKLDAINQEVQTQKGSLNALQSKSFGEVRDSGETLRRRLDEMNANMSAKIHELEEEIGRTSAAASSLSFLLIEQVNVSASTELELANLQKSHRREKIAVARNISRINRRLAWKDRQIAHIRATVRMVTVDLVEQKQITEDIKKSMTSDREGIGRKLNRLDENVTELHANFLLMRGQIQNLHSIAEISRRRLNETEIRLANLTSRVDDDQGQMQQAYDKSWNEISTKLENAVSRLNRSHQRLMKEQSELSNMRERSLVSEERMMMEITNLRNITNTASLQTSDLQSQIMDNHILIQALRSNLSTRAEELQDGDADNKNNIREIKKKVLDLNSTMIKSIVVLEKVGQNLTSIWKKFEDLHETMQEDGEKLGQNEEENNQTKLLILKLQTDVDKLGMEIEAERSRMHQMKESQAASAERNSIKIASFQQEIESQLLALRETTGVEMVKMAERVSGLEMSNTSLHNVIQDWSDELNAIKGGIKSLRKAERALSTAVSTYQSTISKHDYVQRNLTKISEKVRKTLRGHGLALKSIRDIMNNLNQSWDGVEVADERSYAEEISSQGEKINAMRSLMQNFSSLLSEVLNDQLSHGVLHATLGARQKSIIEILDSSNVQIDEMRQEARRNAEKVASVEASLAANSNHFQTIVGDLENFSRTLARLDDKEDYLDDVILNLNFTQLANQREMKSWSAAFRQELTEFVAKQRENTHRHENAAEAIAALSQNVGRINQTASHFIDEVNQVKALQKDASVKFEEVVGLVETNNKRLTDLNTTTLDAVRSLENSMSHIQDSRRISDSHSSERIANISLQIESLQRNVSMTQRSIDRATENVAQIEKRSFETEEALAEIRDAEIQRINNAITKSTMRLIAMEGEIESHATGLQSLSANSSDILASVHRMADNLLDQEARMNDLLKLHSDRASKKDTDELRKMLGHYHTNVSEIEVKMLQLSRSLDYNYNSTQLIFDLLDGQEERMTLLHDESSALMPSIAESISNLDYSLGKMNASIRYHVSDLTDLLRDFQAAFDTSNREIARYVNEFNIMKINSSNQFAHLSTTTEYLTQIIHETNKVVDENQDRMDAINETVIYLKLSIPTLDDIDGQLAGSSLEKSGTSRVTLDGFPAFDHEDVDKALTVDGDDGRERRPVTNWFEEEVEDIGNDDYFGNYEQPPLEREKRIAREVRRINGRVSQMVNVIETLQTYVYRIGNQSEGFTTFPEQPIAKGAVTFSTGLTSRFVCCGVVVFDKVYVNSGEGYDHSTGKFAAPENGMYAFFISVAERNSFVRGALIQNGMSLIAVQLDHTGHYEQSQSSNFVVLYLTAGTQVWVQIFAGTLQSYQSPTVTFSGFLVSPVS